MSHNLTEISAFDANVTVPDGGDARRALSVEVPLQSLANRSRYLYDQIVAVNGAINGEVGSYLSVAGAPITTPNKVPWTQIFATSGLTLSADEITCTKGGIYLICGALAFASAATTTPAYMPLSIDRDGTQNGQIIGVRLSATATDYTVVPFSHIMGVSNGQKIAIRVRAGAALTPITGGVCEMNIIKLR